MLMSVVVRKKSFTTQKRTGSLWRRRICTGTICSAFHPLQWYFRDRDDVYVSGNLFVYYEEGNPKKCVAPDVFVVFGVPKRRRRVYLVWEEGRDWMWFLSSPAGRRGMKILVVRWTFTGAFWALRSCSFLTRSGSIWSLRF